MPLTTAAFRMGDELGNVLNTDIKVYIDGVQIAGYNIEMKTYVIAEDLIPYGFNVVWNSADRSLRITDGVATGTPKPVPANTGTPGSVAFPYIYTDINAYINDRWVRSYNIQGSTAVNIEDLAEAFGYLSWTSAGRELRFSTKYSLFTSRELDRILEINKMLADIAPKSQDIYIAEPDIQPPYNIGRLSQQFLNDGLNYINFVRYMAGLPPVSLSDDYNNRAQHGAFVLSATGRLTHGPSNTADLPDDLFSTGRSACASSNLGRGHRSLYYFNRSCMDDSDSSNISGVGHRRWLLSPVIGQIGMGYANGWSATYVFDNSVNFTDWDTINWPSAGLFPRRELYAHTAWSVSLGNNYRTTGDTEVKIVRENDKKIWLLSGSSAKTGREYFNISGAGYGRNGPCIIFRPDVEQYKIGEIYTVTITGLTDSDGEPRVLQYTVKFF
jgi:uncharacterized protein YkwD